MKLGFVSGTEVVHAQSYYQPRKQRQHLHVRSVARKASGTRQTERDGERERENASYTDAATSVLSSNKLCRCSSGMRWSQAAVRAIMLVASSAA